MLKNYLIIAIRNIQRNKIFSLINILGLSVGISASLVIFLVVYFEFSYDNFEQDRNQIYRVVLDANFGGVPGHSAAVPAPLSEAINRELTGIDKTIPVIHFPGDGNPSVTTTGTKAFKETEFKHESDIIFTNAAYFELLGFRWLSGSPDHSLKDAFEVVLTETRARQYFPRLPLEEIIGRQIIYNKEVRVTVSGIVEDLNKNTSFTGREFVSIPTIMNTGLKDRLMMNAWDDWMAYSQILIKLNSRNAKQAVETQLNNLYNKYNPGNLKNPANSISLVLQPLKDIHFDSKYAGFGQRLVTMTTMYGLLVVALFLLTLACMNFINLSTAQASHRAKEIGIRKTMGSSKKQLIVQFLGETFLITLLATIVSVLLTPLLLKAFDQFIPEGLEMNLKQQPFIILFLFLLTILISFIAGFYPAVIMSGFNPVRSLKNQSYISVASARSSRVRKMLTVSQFAIAQFFIIGTLIVSKQIDFSINQNIGFRKDAILNINLPYDSTASKGSKLVNELNAIPEIARVSSGFFSPASTGVAYTNVKYAGKEDLKDQVQLRWGDSNYLKIYEIEILAGRNVRKTDSFQEFLINETYAKELGFSKPEMALNKLLSFNGKNIPIVGVMKNFHMMSTHSPIGPLVFAGGLGSTLHILLKPRTDNGKNWQTAIEKIKNSFHLLYPNEDCTYSFVDDNLAKMYEGEKHISKLLYWSTGLTILISCMGLLGMVIYVTNARLKEIGVRKVLGAPIHHIIYILSKDFLKLVLVGFFIAAPLSWWASYKWLEGFVYRTPISWWIFVVCIVLILSFALITLSIQTLRAALANPVKSLKTE